MPKQPKNQKICRDCGKSRHRDDFRYGNSTCRDCDTEPAGTWFLSYLCELGYIRNFDSVELGYVDGVLKREFLGLPEQTLIYITIDRRDKTLFHLSYLPGRYQGDEGDDDDDDEDNDNDEVDEKTAAADTNKDEDIPTKFEDADDEEDDDTVWWERPSAKTFDFRFDLSELKIIA